MTLIVKLTPYENESLAGYLLRLSERNVVPNVKRLLGSLDLKPRLAYGAVQLDQMAENFGVDSVELSRRQPSVDASTALLRRKFQRGEVQPVCTACLAEQPYVRMAWGHVLVTACPTHHLTLLDVCPRCTLPLSTARERIGHCDCGQSLTALACPAATEPELAITALLMGVEHPARQLLPLPWREGQPPASIAELLVFLAKHLGSPEGAEKKRGTAARPSSLADARQELNKIWSVIAQWPMGFDRRIEALLVGSEGPGLAKRLGGWYRALHQHFADSAYAFIHKALMRQLTENFDGHLNLRLSTVDPQHLQEKCWLTAEEAGRLIGMGAELVRSAITTQEVKGKVVVRGASRFVSIHRDEVETIRRNRQAYYTATEVRKQLGVSKVLFERLMQAGALRKQAKKQRPALVSAEFKVKDVEALVTRLHGALERREVPMARQIGLHDISVRRGISTDRICSVLHKILALEIRAVALNPGLHGLAGLRFDLDDLKDEVVEEQPEVKLLVSEVVNLRGWKQECIMTWIKQGLLKATVETRDNHSVTLVSLSALLDFMSTYAVLAELAHRANSKSPWILRGLMPAGVKPVSTKASYGVQRGLLLSIDELLAAAQWNKRGSDKNEVA